MADGVQSLNRALGILETLACSSHGLGILELSQRVKLPASTTHRLLSTLGRKGYVTQLHDEKYLLGHKLIEMGRNFLESSHLIRIVRPYLEAACGETGETTNLVVLDQDEAFYLDKVECPRILRVFSRIGHRAPLYCTGAGKVLLTGFSEEQLKRYLGNTELRPLTRNTITSTTSLERELARVRARGFAYDLEECEVGARCVAVPIRGFMDRVVAALSISGPAMRLRRKEMKKAVRCLLEINAEVSAKLR